MVTDNYDTKQLIELNNYCHNHNIGFIYGNVLGLYTNCFVDFGDMHKIIDKDGEELKNCLVSFITQEEKAKVILPEGHRHGLNDGESVTFCEI